MSSFVVSPKCMQQVVFAILDVKAQEYVSVPNDRRFAGVILPIGALRDVNAAASEIGRKLYAMNVAAVQERYPDTIERPEHTPGPCDDQGIFDFANVIDFAYRPTDARCNRMQAYTSIQCLLYQCSEGEIDKSPLYAELESVLNRIACNIVDSLPEYDAAKWDAA
jgi:hypothetical protein